MAEIVRGHRSPVRVATKAIVAVAAMTGPMLVIPALGSTAFAGEQPTTNGHGHGKVVFPTRSNAPKAGYAGAASGTGQLRYGGAVDGIGVTTGPPKVYLVFYGSQW